MKIDCSLIPQNQFGSQGDFIAVVVDVLRATSTIVSAFMNGCESVVPVAAVEEAFRLREGSMARSLIGGERGGRALDGFHFGNSPQEYTPEKVGGQTVILTTTNGTRAFRSLPRGAVGLVAAFLNLGAVARHCAEAGRNLMVICSGREGGFSLEDTVCAGALVESICGMVDDRVELTDAACAAGVLYGHFRGDLIHMLRSTLHGKYLISIGLEEDLEYCGRIDRTDMVPVYRNGRIELAERLADRGALA